MALSLSKIVPNFLRERSDSLFTARQIAEWVLETYPDDCRQKLADSTFLKNEEGLEQQLVSEITALKGALEKKHPQFKTTSDRPRKYYWTEKSNEQLLIEAGSHPDSSSHKTMSGSVKEVTLYPKLCSFLWTDSNLYCKRINEKRSSNTKGRSGNEWLHPDIVAIEDVSASWEKNVKELAIGVGEQMFRVWSFEVKTRINLANVRSSFFQTLSNSSWAHFSYLVAAEIEGKAENELKTLCNLHGVGLIKLDIENPVESEFRIYAKEETGIDWPSFGRLYEENADFREFAEKLREFQKGVALRPAEWDGAQESA